LEAPPRLEPNPNQGGIKAESSQIKAIQGKSSQIKVIPRKKLFPRKEIMRARQV
jgi:hypothetical protein